MTENYVFVKLYVPCRDDAERSERSTESDNSDNIVIEVVIRFKNRAIFETHEDCNFDEQIEPINDWLHTKYPQKKYFMDDVPDYDTLQNVTEYDINVEN
jgi:hypothetical protein